MDNSVDPSSQSTAHAEACSAIVERVDMEAHYLHRWLTRVFAFGNGDFATSSDVRVKRLVFWPRVERIVTDSGIFRIFAG